MRTPSATSVIVIGAGIAGAATAFALARRGVGVTVLDDGATGQATAASAGIIAPWASTSTGRFYDLYAAGGAFYPELLAQLAESGVTRTDYRRTGTLVVDADDAALATAEERLRRRVADAGSVAGTVERLEPAEARALFPPLAPELGALLVTGGGRVDGRTLRDALLEAAARNGAVRRSGTATLVSDGPGERAVVEFAGRRLEADAVVVAAGTWTARLVEPLGLTVPIAPQRGQIAHLRLDGVDTSSWPTVTPLSHHYLVAFDSGRIAAGATRETGSGFDARVTATGQLQVLQDALGIAPGLADATLIETRVGLRPLAEELPVVGALPGDESVWVVSGYGAAGLTMGPLMGDAVARAITGEDAPEVAGLAPRAG